jgi:PucR C-terminal helix-turn-helix domain/GGDEF-like domain
VTRRASDELRSAAALADRLRARREEIEQVISARVSALARTAAASDPEYAAGLRAAIAAGIDHAIDAIGRGGTVAAPIPAAMTEQARLAARSGVGLDTVLRRYLAGHAMIGDFLVEEADGHVSPDELKRLLRRLATAIDGAITQVTAAYNEEAEVRPRGAGRRRAELVEHLLAGELLDARELGYELDANHLGFVAAGRGVGGRLGQLAEVLDARLLSVQREREVVWAWLGRRGPIEPEVAGRHIEEILPSHGHLALGEPCAGPSGWRLTHRQARAAFPIARRSPGTLVRYADVALIATILQDELASISLRGLFLKPLEAERDGGATLRETLRAYFATERNVSSAAIALGVNRNTVASRLREVEARIGRSLHTCGAEVEAALRLHDVTDSTTADDSIMHTAGRQRSD